MSTEDDTLPFQYSSKPNVFRANVRPSLVERKTPRLKLSRLWSEASTPMMLGTDFFQTKQKPSVVDLPSENVGNVVAGAKIQMLACLFGLQVVHLVGQGNLEDDDEAPFSVVSGGGSDLARISCSLRHDTAYKPHEVCLSVSIYGRFICTGVLMNGADTTTVTSQYSGWNSPKDNPPMRMNKPALLSIPAPQRFDF